MSQVTVSCTKEQLTRLDAEARERKTTREDVAARYLADGLARSGAKAPRPPVQQDGAAGKKEGGKS